MVLFLNGVLVKHMWAKAIIDQLHVDSRGLTFIRKASVVSHHGEFCGDPFGIVIIMVWARLGRK